MKQAVEIITRGVCCVDGRVLLCLTRGDSNSFLPGGHVDFGESARVALEREVREELGMDSRAGRFLGAVEHAFTQRGEPHCEVNLVFEVSIPTLTPDSAPVSAEPHLEFRWVAVDELAAAAVEPRPLSELVPAWLRTVNGVERFGSTLA